jgi:hypothetical protein
MIEMYLQIKVKLWIEPLLATILTKKIICFGNW